MALLDTYSEEMMAGAMAVPPVAPKPQAPRFSLWGTTAAAPKGLAAGAAENIASTADILGAFGQVMGATDGRAGGMFSTMTPKERTDFERANEQLATEGVDYRSEGGRLFRNVAKEYMPDPLTAHGAEVVVGDLFRLGGKAVSAGMTLGPVAGAVVSGLEEGFTASDKLADQGVDLKTRTKVGAVTAAVTAAGFALPVAGKTIPQTVGLALAGGPLSFMGQQAATRSILEGADYSKLADQYDPFDPVGLALSTILPLGFGAMAMRGAKARAKVADAEKATDITERDAASPESVDAARVGLLREGVDRTNPLPDDMGASQPHVEAYAKAIDQQADGQRVDVADGLPDAMALRATEEMAVRLAPLIREINVDLIEAARIRQAADTMRDRGMPDVAARHDDLAESHELKATRDAAEARQGFDINTLTAEASRLLDGGRQAADVIGELSAAGKVAPELHNALVAAQQFAGRLDELGAQFKALEAAKPAAQPFDLIAEAVERMRAGQPVEAPKAGKVEIDPMTARIAEVEARNPRALDAEVPVAYDSDGKVTERMSARDYLAEIKRIAEIETKDGELLQVAANCFLNLGP